MSRLTFEERVKIMDWLDRHRDEAKNLSVSELIPRIRADIHLRALSRDAVKEAARVRGVAFREKKRASFSSTVWHDVTAVLAKSIRQIAEEAGIKLELEEELKLITSRTNLPTDKTH